ncbi:type IV toxin-antitoxin system AbiEi family antitoxin domain-containing protein [Propionibacteriaceae bacterium G1746]
MKPRAQVPEQLEVLASNQGGLVTREQALAAGLSARQIAGLVSRGAWARLARGVFAVRFSSRSWDDLAWAGVLLAGDGAALGAEAAAHLYGFAPASLPIDVWITSGPGATRPRIPLDQPDGVVWRFHRGERKVVGSPPRTSIEQTVLDLCAGADADQQSHWLGQALANRRTTVTRLTRALDDAPRLTGRRQLAELLEVAGGGSHSPLEVRYLRDVERAHGLPHGVRQQSVSSGTRSDMVYDEFNLIVELDGQLGHRGAGELRDSWRDARHLSRGLGTLRFGWPDVVRRACEMAALIAAVLQNNGWTGQLRPCRACRAAA